MVAAAQKAAVTKFFSAQHFAVVGASPDVEKFGFKGPFPPTSGRMFANLSTVFQWYINHNIPATPINPKKPTILNIQALASISELPEPSSTSLSIITPPKVTLATIKQAIELGINAVWLQPGSFDDEGLNVAREGGLTVVAGLEGSRAHDGWCVLVDGEAGLRSAGRKGPEWKL